MKVERNSPTQPIRASVEFAAIPRKKRRRRKHDTPEMGSAMAGVSGQIGNCPFEVFGQQNVGNSSEDSGLAGFGREEKRSHRRGP
jgi:hypothetical protein